MVSYTDVHAQCGLSCVRVCAVLYENAVAKMAEDAEGEGPAAAQRTEFFSSVDKGLHCFFFPFFIC